VDAVMARVALASHCARAGVILTGEGRLDEQSFCGKVVSGVAALGKRLGLPVYVVAGETAVDEKQWRPYFTGVAAVTDEPGTKGSDPSEALAARTEAAVRIWLKDA
jgi:glycerate kinase